MNFLTKIYEDNTEFQGYLNSLSSDNSSIYIHGVIKEAFASFVYATCLLYTSDAADDSTEV